MEWEKVHARSQKSEGGSSTAGEETDRMALPDGGWLYRTKLFGLSPVLGVTMTVSLCHVPSGTCERCRCTKVHHAAD